MSICCSFCWWCGSVVLCLQSWKQRGQQQDLRPEHPLMMVDMLSANAWFRNLCWGYHITYVSCQRHCRYLRWYVVNYVKYLVVLVPVCFMWCQLIETNKMLGLFPSWVFALCCGQLFFLGTKHFCPSSSFPYISAKFSFSNCPPGLHWHLWVLTFVLWLLLLTMILFLGDDCYSHSNTAAKN